MRIFQFLICLCTTLLLAACSTYAANNSFAKRPEVQAFIQDMSKKHGFSTNELNTIFSQVKVRPQTIRHVIHPAEAQPWYLYQRVFITEMRIREGVEFWDRYAEPLAVVERTYGVPASIIVATIGVESKYGKNSGSFRVIDALTNNAFNHSRRSGYFRDELEDLLLLSREQNLDPLKVMGSYAGAIGQPQFMPSSYRRFAVSYTGSKHIDLSRNQLDVIVSIANYYHKHGWQYGMPVAVPAKVHGRQYQYLVALDKPPALSNAQLAYYGVFAKNPYPIDLKAKLVQLQDRWSYEYWLRFQNFDVIMRYNPSVLYAMAVYQLSDSITLLKKTTPLYLGSSYLKYGTRV